jgi:hypothetical protein
LPHTVGDSLHLEFVTQPLPSVQLDRAAVSVCPTEGSLQKHLPAGLVTQQCDIQPLPGVQHSKAAGNRTEGPSQPLLQVGSVTEFSPTRPGTADVQQLTKSATVEVSQSRPGTVDVLHSETLPLPVEPPLPFIDEDFAIPPSVGEPAKPLLKTSSLRDKAFVLPRNKDGEFEVFVDKILPPLSQVRETNPVFSPDYFAALHLMVNAAGPSYPVGTPNHLGARLPLQHTALKL